MANWSPLDPETDRRLVSDLHDGDESSLASLYDDYAERLYDYCSSMTRQPGTAADILHDTFVDAARRAPRMRNRGHLRAWLYAAARRRCLQQRVRSRERGLRWDWSGAAGAQGGPGDGRPDGDARAVLEGALRRLDFGDQEILLLVLRHRVTGEDLAAVLQIGLRRANALAAKVWTLAESAVGSEVLEQGHRCTDCDRAAARPVRTAASERREPIRSPADGLADGPAEGAVERAAECPDCLRAGDLTVSALLRMPPAAVVPTGLRHRVLHTGTDPELAEYRAEIVARGGHLTPEGMPRQPDVPSPIARRWIFTGGGVAGALVAALVAAFIIGPGLPTSEIEWPWRHRPPQGESPSRGLQVQGPVHLPSTALPGGRPNLGDPAVPQVNGSAAPQTPRPTQTPKPSQQPTPTPSPSPTQFTVGPQELTLELGQETYLELSALHGPVSWSAVTSTGQLELARQQGVVAKNHTYKLKITLRRLLVQLPGQAVITFTSSTGEPQNVQVTWGLSLLHS